MGRLRFTSFIILFSLVATSVGHATLLNGKTVNFQYYYPDLSTPYSGANNGNKLVGNGIEISNLADGLGTIDISDTNILVRFSFPIPPAVTFMNPATFNGFVLSDAFGTIGPFTGITIGAATNMAGFNATRVAFDADHIFVNWAGLAFNSNTVVSLDVASSAPATVPEPATIVLLITGLAMLRVRWCRVFRRDEGTLWLMPTLRSAS